MWRDLGPGALMMSMGIVFVVARPDLYSAVFILVGLNLLTRETTRRLSLSGRHERVHRIFWFLEWATSLGCIAAAVLVVISWFQ